MKRKEIVFALFLAAAMISSAPSSAQSVGGSQSERSGTDTQTPLPPKSSSSGSADESKVGKNPTKQTRKTKDDKSVGGSQSERNGTDNQTPLSSKSPDAKRKASKNASKQNGKAQRNKDASVGGSQSERSGTDTQTPIPPGSQSSGSSK